MRFVSLSRRLSLALLLSFLPSGLFASGSEGTVNFVMRTGSWFDEYTDNPSSSTQEWLRDHFWRMQSTSPYFDSRLSWFPNAYVYLDLYGIPTDSSLVGEHPEWILKDSSGHFLYIPFACNGSSCSQYAADPGNAAFRSYWISQAKSTLDKGYKGLWIDDVNLAFRVGNGNGTQIAPHDPRTGSTMTIDAWMQYVADFTKAIRSGVPDTEIVHNSIWFAGGDERDQNPSVIEEIQNADYIDCERGVSDAGLTGGTGDWSLNALFGFVDHVHALGKKVFFDEYQHNGEYGLAGYFLISTGGDAEGDQSMTPNNWWSGYDASLGTAQNTRYTWNNLLRRDFSGGLVLLNPPDSSTVSVTLPQTFTRIDGSSVSHLSLAAGQGAVLLGATSASPKTQTVQINAGGNSQGDFSYDTDYSGGQAASTGNSIDTSGVSNPAPQAVYQSERWSPSSYTIPNLTVGKQYTVRLHFAEFYWTGKGQRIFSVTINGTTVLSNFDIVAAAGSANKAIVKEFTATANQSGNIVINFLDGDVDHAKISGIEVQ